MKKIFLLLYIGLLSSIGFSQNGYNVKIKSNNLNIKQIELYDIFGKLLMEKKANESTVTLDVSPYAKGMYLLRYTLSNDMQQTKKIIKELLTFRIIEK